MEENAGLILKEWSVDPKTGELDVNHFKQLLTDKTRLVCMSHCSNVLGHVNDVKEVTVLAHQVGARVVVDGVAYAPHAVVDVKDLDVDFYLFSLYKFFGPHLGVLYAKKPYLRTLKNQGHYFNDDFVRKRLSPSGPQYAEIISALGVIDYYRLLHQHHFSEKKAPGALFEMIKEIFALIYHHEGLLAQHLLNYLSEQRSVRILGYSTLNKAQRFPVISFVVNNKSSKEVVDHLIRHRIATNNGHFYAIRLLKAIGVKDVDDGVVRLSFLHYNTQEEIERVIKALEFIL